MSNEIWVAIITGASTVLLALIGKWRVDTRGAAPSTHKQAHEEIVTAATEEHTVEQLDGLHALVAAQGRQIEGLVDTLDAQNRRLTAQNKRLDQQDLTIAELREREQQRATITRTYVQALRDHILAQLPPPPPAEPEGWWDT